MSGFVCKIVSKIKTWTNHCFRIRINRQNRRRLKNTDITLISSNCNGCLILHDLGLQYNSPFVNMFIEADDYVKLLQNFFHYMSLELSFLPDSDRDYPVAVLGDVLLHCVHYKSEEEVVEKWNKRKQRMDMSHCFVMFTDRDGCSREHLEAFDALPMTNKIVFTHKPYHDIPSSFYIKGFEDEECVGNLNRYTGWSGKKYYDDFDYVAWFNQE